MWGRKPATAFTLIELLVVVAVIAGLIAILLPALANARDQARSIKCLSNLHDMSLASRTFATSHRGRFQLVTDTNGSSASKLSTAERTSGIYYEWTVGDNVDLKNPYEQQLMVWPAVLIREASPGALKSNLYRPASGTIKARYGWGYNDTDARGANARELAQKGMLPKFEQHLCPSDKSQIASAGWPDYFNPASNTVTNVRYWGYLSYGINEDITGGDSPGRPGTVWDKGSGSQKRLRSLIERIQRPSEVAMFLDMGKQAGETDIYSNLLGSTKSGPYLQHADQRLPFERHRRGSVNVSFADGHGGFVKRIQTATNTYTYTPTARISPYRP